ncbi:MAG: hypothetical protein ACE5I5_11985, partial [Candidatus Heimdallarchaeota archaeon]
MSHTFTFISDEHEYIHVPVINPQGVDHMLVVYQGGDQFVGLFIPYLHRCISQADIHIPGVGTYRSDGSHVVCESSNQPECLFIPH